MCAEETKDRGPQEGCADVGCGPEIFQEFFEKFAERCGGEGGFPDCAEMMKSCCGVTMDKTKADSGK